MTLKKSISYALIAAAILVSGCSQQDFFETTGAKDDNQIINLIEGNENHLRVSLSDINTAVNTLQSKSNAAKSRSGLPSYEITEFQNNGKTEFYVVNFEDNNGFILLSATKALNPVLAYSETGNFSIENKKPEGLENWISNIAVISNKRNELPEDSLKETIYQWNQLLHKAENAEKIVVNQSAPNKSSKDIFESGKRMLELAIDDAIDRGAVEFYYPNEDFCNDENISAGVWDVAQDYVYIDFQECWQDYVFVAKCLSSKYEYIKEPRPTKWGQENGYNILYEPDENGKFPPAGCAPVAAAQFMYHHRHPNSYPWNQMQPYKADIYNAQLIHDIAVACKTVNGITYNGPFYTYMKSLYNMTWDMFNIDNTLIIDKISQYGPVIVIGKDATNGGHSWLANGYRKISQCYNYVLYYIEDPYIEASYKDVATEEPHKTEYAIYMNWGWEGLYDGYYTDPRIDGLYSFKYSSIMYGTPRN